MCGRYAASADKAQLVEVFGVDEVVIDRVSGAQRGQGERWLAPRYNIAPTDTVPVVLSRASSDAAAADGADGAEAAVTRRLAGLQWGLVPSWAKDAKGGARLINARLETVAEKPSFRSALARRRCLLPADGYYEWYQTTQLDARSRPIKQPFYIHPIDGVPVSGGHPGIMAMAGLFEYWKNPAPAPGEDPWLVSCCIITTAATDELGVIHDRMPVTVPPAAWDQWLDPGHTDGEAALDALREPMRMGAYAVSRLVSSIRNDGPELIEPLKT